jgi:hypothetical protein
VSRIIDDLILGAIGACIVMSLGLNDCSCSSPLSAQSRLAALAPAEPGDLEDVARCLVAENVPGTDWGAILDVLERRARRAHVSVGRMARAYCAIHRAGTPTKRQQRIRALPAPDSRRRLLDSYERALVAARRGGPGTCTADHWGDRAHDTARALRLGWQPVDCGATANAFFKLP